MKYCFLSFLLSILFFDMNSCTAIKYRTRGFALIEIKAVDSTFKKNPGVLGLSIAIDKEKKKNGLWIEVEEVTKPLNMQRRLRHSPMSGCEVRTGKWSLKRKKALLKENGEIKYNHQRRARKSDFEYCLFTRDQIQPFLEDSIGGSQENKWVMPNYLQISGTKINFSRNGTTKGKQFSFKIEPILIEEEKDNVNNEYSYIKNVAQKFVLDSLLPKPDFQLAIPCPPNWDDKVKSN